MRSRLVLFALVFLPLLACPAKEDYTAQIRVAPGFKDRLGLRQHFQSRDAGARVARTARVHTLAAGDELGGPNAVGRPGDLVLENDEVVFVVNQLGGGMGFAETGGNVVDAADARVRKDELGLLFTYFGTFPRQGVYGRLTSGVAPNGSAWIEASGHELLEPRVAVTTRYTLSPDDRALLLHTTLANESDHVVLNLGLGDAIQWGGAEKFAPGKAVGFKGPSSGPFVGGIGRFTSYGITSTDGTIDAVNGGSWTDTEQEKGVRLAPGESVSYSRVFVVGERGDSASVISELTRASAGEVGSVEVSLVEGGRPASVAVGGKAVLSTLTGGEVMSLVAMSAGAVFGGEVPPGKYQIAYAGGGGRRGVGPMKVVDVAAGEVARAELSVSGAGELVIECTETRARDDGGTGVAPGPCKATVEGLSGTPTPDLGPSHVAGPAKNQITTADGHIDVALSPGRYRITLSRGPEFSIATWEQEVKASPERTLAAGTLTRVVDTTGYVATDFHQHTMLGADSAVALRDRVIANAAEGVEVAVASEHNIVADLQPIVSELHLGPFLVEIPGNELTTDASKKPWGHANVFPLAVDKARSNGGAPEARDRTAKDLFAEMRAIPTPHVLQVNHPRTGITGYFDQLRFDPLTGMGTDPDYDPKFDALEVWNGRNVQARAKVVADFFALLRTSHPVTATADTDTHGIVGQEAGYPRTYVKVASDRRFEDWDADRSADMVRGVRELRDVVLTNGPFLRVTVNRAPIGGIARAANGSVHVKLHVESAPWIAVTTARVECVNTPSRQPIALTPKPNAAGALVVDRVIAVPIIQDDACIVTVSGPSPMTPVLAGDSAEISPYAMTGAFWVDFDGDGKSLGR